MFVAEQTAYINHTLIFYNQKPSVKTTTKKKTSVINLLREHVSKLLTYEFYDYKLDH